MNHAEKPAGLSRVELGGCLGVSLVVFALCQGPIWRHRWRIDASIWWSYVVIPFVVAALLAWSHRLAWRAFALGVIEVTCWKFGATYLFAHTMWMFFPPPPRAAVPAPSLPDAPNAVAPGRPVVPSETGSIAGSVRDASGRSVAGSVAFIESGLEAYAFGAPAAGPSFSVRSGVIEPALDVAELHGALRARSSDGKLHTLIASQGDADLFNLPLQSSGALSTSEVRRGLGIVSLRCAVHERAGEIARLVVVSHPFHAILDGAGRFDWSGVPAGRVTVAALQPDGRLARSQVEVVAGVLATTTLVLTSN
jgi:hypothetical protein